MLKRHRLWERARGHLAVKVRLLFDLNYIVTLVTLKTLKSAS